MIYTIDDIASRWQCGRKAVYALVQDGKIPAFKVGYYWRIREEDLLKYESTPLNQTKFIRG